jgi:RNA polymerase sigma-70 factor (ECF subfamily)
VPLDDLSSDRDLVARALHDPEAFAVLYRRYVLRVRAFAVRRCGSTTLADDITAVVFERAWRNLSGLEVPDHGVGPWLFRIASNELASHFRKIARGRRAQERLESAPPSRVPDPADITVERADHAAIRQALTRLNERHQEVISLRYLAGLSPQETADIMGTTPPVVAAVLHRALKALEQAMNRQRLDRNNVTQHE